MQPTATVVAKQLGAHALYYPVRPNAQTSTAVAYCFCHRFTIGIECSKEARDERQGSSRPKAMAVGADRARSSHKWVFPPWRAPRRRCVASADLEYRIGPGRVQPYFLLLLCSRIMSSRSQPLAHCNAATKSTTSP